jgi:RNase adaptor protein for sRNA GlmZ degradation
MLKVDIYSFSYKQRNNLPVNTEGGGFVFDCRCLPNPGREEAFKAKSGLDQEVKEYLTSRPEVDKFYRLLEEMVGQSVRVYLSRDFSSLSISFGCTGGQHRSVFLAEKLAENLRNIQGVAVEVQHLNKDNWVKKGS